MLQLTETGWLSAHWWVLVNNQGLHSGSWLRGGNRTLVRTKVSALTLLSLNISTIHKIQTFILKVKCLFNEYKSLYPLLVSALLRAESAHEGSMDDGCMEDGCDPAKHLEPFSSSSLTRLDDEDVDGRSTGAAAGQQSGQPGFITLSPGWEGLFVGAAGGSPAGCKCLANCYSARGGREESCGFCILKRGLKSVFFYADDDIKTSSIHHQRKTTAPTANDEKRWWREKEKHEKESWERRTTRQDRKRKRTERER